MSQISKNNDYSNTSSQYGLSQVPSNPLFQVSSPCFNNINS